MNLSLFVIFSIFFNPQTVGLWIANTFFPPPKDGPDNYLIGTLRLYTQPLFILFYNSIIIPFLCDLIGRLEGHSTKSRRQTSIMKKNFYFQIMNTIFVPLTLNSAISVFFSNIDWEKLNYEYVVSMMMANFAGLIFITLTLQWTFISNGMSMLDIFHHVFKFITYT